MPVPSHLWVKYEEGDPTRVKTENCGIVDDFKEAVKVKLKITAPPQDITLSRDDQSGNLNPRDTLEDVLNDYDARTSTIIVTEFIFVFLSA